MLPIILKYNFFLIVPFQQSLIGTYWYILLLFKKCTYIHLYAVYIAHVFMHFFRKGLIDFFLLIFSFFLFLFIYLFRASNHTQNRVIN